MRIYREGLFLHFFMKKFFFNSMNIFRRSLSFRNSEEINKNEWHSQSKGKAMRNRRSVFDEIEAEELDDVEDEFDDDSNEEILTRRRRNLRKTDSETAVARVKRDVPCVTNYNSNRQLLVGCTEPNIIEVRPQCTEDGDEGNF